MVSTKKTTSSHNPHSSRTYHEDSSFAKLWTEFCKRNLNCIFSGFEEKTRTAKLNPRKLTWNPTKWNFGKWCSLWFAWWASQMNQRSCSFSGKRIYFYQSWDVSQERNIAVSILPIKLIAILPLKLGVKCTSRTHRIHGTHIFTACIIKIKPCR